MWIKIIHNSGRHILLIVLWYFCYELLVIQSMHGACIMSSNRWWSVWPSMSSLTKYEQSDQVWAVCSSLVWDSILIGQDPPSCRSCLPLSPPQIQSAEQIIHNKIFQKMTLGKRIGRTVECYRYARYIRLGVIIIVDKIITTILFNLSAKLIPI